MERLLYHLWINLLLGPKSEQLDILLNAFESAVEVYNAQRNDLRKVEGIKAYTIDRIMKNKSLDAAKAEILACRRMGVNILPSYSEKFPKRLLNIHCPPHILYVKGDIGDIDEELCISIVGTRKCTRYGAQVGRHIANGLAKNGVTVVSGGAKGVDTAAINGALDAYGRTIVVLGSGIDVIYPSENRRLFDEVSKNGAVITEYPTGTRPLPNHFPQRNRIISGLSQGTLIIEAPKGSGSLITANYALEQGRDVFAVPGDITQSNNEGSNELIKAGAYPVTDAKDILSQYEYFAPVMYENLKNRLEKEINRGTQYENNASKPEGKHRDVVSVSKEELKRALKIEDAKPERDVKKTSPDKDDSRYDELQKQIISLLRTQNMNVDELMVHLDKSVSEVNSALIALEMMGDIIKNVDKRYSIS